MDRHSPKQCPEVHHKSDSAPTTLEPDALDQSGAGIAADGTPYLTYLPAYRVACRCGWAMTRALTGVSVVGKAAALEQARDLLAKE